MLLTAETVKQAIQKSLPLVITSYSLSLDVYAKIEKILLVYLRAIQQPGLHNQLFYILRELADNAKKANLKRIYFKEKGLSIDNNSNYEEGIKDFKQEVIAQSDSFSAKLKEHDLYTKIRFLLTRESLVISIKNNALVTQAELDRINKRLEFAKELTTIGSALTKVRDNVEGAGLGIVMMLIILKKMGLSQNAFRIFADTKETVAELTIPRNDIITETLNILVKKVVDEIKSVPQFPEHISMLLQKIEDPNSSFRELETIIIRDPGLTADLLRLTNSAYYAPGRKVETVSQALNLVGIKGLKSALIAHGAQKAMEDKYGEMKELWEMSYKIAFFAEHIAKDYKKKISGENIYISALLQDLGMIMINFLEPGMVETFKLFRMEKDIDEELFEQFLVGMHHAEIGARIAERWNFPEQIVDVIRYHEEPEKCSEETAELVKIVYLAKILIEHNKGEVTLEQISSNVLADFDIYSEDELEDLHTKCLNDFNGLKQ